MPTEAGEDLGHDHCPFQYKPFYDFMIYVIGITFKM